MPTTGGLRGVADWSAWQFWVTTHAPPNGDALLWGEPVPPSPAADPFTVGATPFPAGPAGPEDPDCPAAAPDGPATAAAAAEVVPDVEGIAAAAAAAARAPSIAMSKFSTSSLCCSVFMTTLPYKRSPVGQQANNIQMIYDSTQVLFRNFHTSLARETK